MVSFEYGPDTAAIFRRRRPVISCRVHVSICLTLLFCTTIAMAWVVPVPTCSNTNRFMIKRKLEWSANNPFIRAPKKSMTMQLGSTSPQAEAIMSSGLEPNELSLLLQMISHECQQLGVSCNDDSIISLSAPVVPLAAAGALGRVLLFRASGFGMDLLEDLEGGIYEQMDMLMCGSADDDDEDGDNYPTLKESVLIYFQTDDALQLELKANKDENENDYCTRYLSAIVEKHVQEYELASPLQTIMDVIEHKKEDASLVPSTHVELDGGYISYPFDNTTQYWDASTLLVFDNLVSQDLRKRLLDVVIGEDSDQHDARNGPNPVRWLRGGLLSHPEESASDDDTSQNGGGWGLTDEGLEEICFEQHDAVQEMESILSDLFPDFVVSRLPETVLGDSVTPMTANAPTAGDVFDYHIDADPNMTPSSPWTDAYGRYPNRAAGKPRFMSCLVYLNEEWDGDVWGAPTRFVDVPTDDIHDLNVYDVKACPGRCIIMDQDIGHTVVAPTAAAGKRPRYSLVWKLILHPKAVGQDMKHLAGRRKSLWPETEYFGSAATQNQPV